MNILMTDAASEYIKKKMDSDKAIGLRLSIKKTGCSGYAYAPEIILEKKNDNDLLLTEKGIDLYVDVLWQHLLDGVEIDFVEENKSGLKQKRLVFRNEKESARCGCGESFHIENV